MIFDRLIGDEATFTLEHRILNTVLLIGLAIAGVTGATNLLLGLRLSAAASAAGFFLLAALYYLSIAKGAYRVAITAATGLIFVIVPVVWFEGGGTAGATGTYILAFAAMIAVCVRRTATVALLSGGLLVLSMALIAAEYHYPWLMLGSAGRDALFADSFIGLSIALIVITSLYIIILGYYRREHERATDYQVKLEKQGLELELARLDRLNLIGEMAASIGHEVRNPLTTIRGFLQVFSAKQEFTRHHEHFAMMIAELDRANAIITEFLSLAKNKMVKLAPCDVNTLLRRLVPLIQAGALEAGKEVALKLGRIPLIAADEGEIRQLVLNLVGNALDATAPGGRVTIGTRREGGQTVLFVSDTGRGIPPEIFARLGTPFVTDKEKGTGLGIPICFRIAERHKAKLEIDTGAQGTTFRLRFAAAGREGKAE